MLPPSVVRVFPFRIDDRTVPDLDNAIARAEAGLSRSFDEIDVRPIVTVMMNVVGDFAEQDSFQPQDAVRLPDERRVRMSKSVLVLFRRSQYKPESHVEIFLIILSLIRNVRRVVHDDIHGFIPERHIRVVGDHIRVV
jgi:hypothetical protein